MLPIRSSRHVAISLSLCLPASFLVGLAVLTSSALALPTAPLKLSLDFKVPDRGVAGTTAGGGTRGRCLPETKVLVPLVPKTNLGLTVSDRPSFFAYVPAVSRATPESSAPESSKMAEFLLLSNDDQEVVYQATFTLPQNPGVVQYDLPEDAPALKAGSRYHWYITLSCDTAIGPSKNPSAQGWIERTALSSNLTKALKTTEPSKRPALYAEAGIWHETLTTLADLHRQNPKNTAVMADWTSVLKSVGLDAVASEPIANRCR